MTGNFVIESFEQKESNCVAIVLIKAAILQYGINRIFRKRRLDDHWVITLKNKDKVILEEKDIERLNRHNKIMFRRPVSRNDKKNLDTIRACVELCFAVMVRYLQSHGFEGKEYTESKAIKLLTRQGLSTNHLHQLLGLPRKEKSATKLTLKDLSRFRYKKAVLLYSDTHIAVVSKGYFDEYGKAVKLGSEPPVLENRKARAWFELKG